VGSQGWQAVLGIYDSTVGSDGRLGFPEGDTEGGFRGWPAPSPPLGSGHARVARRVLQGLFGGRFHLRRDMWTANAAGDAVAPVALGQVYQESKNTGFLWDRPNAGVTHLEYIAGARPLPLTEVARHAPAGAHEHTMVDYARRPAFPGRTRAQRLETRTSLTGRGRWWTCSPAISFVLWRARAAAPSVSPAQSDKAQRSPSRASSRSYPWVTPFSIPAAIIPSRAF
jgi:hypothetical protein